jgi:Secretion system C-terminal sorting domain
MKKQILQAALCLPMLWATDMAQAQHNHLGCGTTIESQESVLDRMFTNRRERESLLARRDLMYRSGDSITFIPIQFHIVGSSNGQGYIELDNLYAGMCRINSDYKDQNIQFFMSGPPIYINNDNLYNNSFENNRSMSTYLMSVYKTPNAMNIFVGNDIVDPPGQFGQTLAYYTGYPDVIYSIKSTINSSSKTLSHEIGHFLTLAHPFVGWENENYTQIAAVSGGKAPLTMGGKVVEKVARSGGTDNCHLAADGFCDTKPDYNFGLYSSACTYVPVAFDPDSVRVDPVSASDNYMSYFNDFCTTGFSSEQKDAIVLDVVQRGYDRLARPDTTAVIGNPAIEWPTSLAPSPYTTAQLRWTPAQNAIYYAVTIDRTLNGSFIARVGQWVTTNPYLWVTLEPNREYTWRVRATNAVDFCANNVTPSERFNSFDWVLSLNTVSNIQSSRVFPNPSGSDKQVSLEINVGNNTEATVSIQNALGQQVMGKQNLSLVQGSNIQTMDFSMLQAGVYFINVETAKGNISHKVLLSE